MNSSTQSAQSHSWRAGKIGMKRLRDMSQTTPAAPIAWNGLVFIGNAGGDIKGVKGRMYALDAKTGKIVWEFQTGSGVVAPPITWEDKGEQYVAVVSGWGGAVPLWGGEVAKKVNFLEQGGSVWVFKLAK
mgnify:CR=1 FL=1